MERFYVAFWDFGAWNELVNTRCKTQWLAETLMKKIQPEYPPNCFEGRSLKVMKDGGVV